MKNKTVTAGETGNESGTRIAGAAERVVGVRDYTASRGYSNAVDWDGENAVVGGTAIKPLYVKDGIAFAPESQVESAVKGIEKRNGIKSSEDIDKAYENKYGKRIDKALEALQSRGGFSYDPETDPAYAAYSRLYRSEAEAAYRKVLNDNNASIRGASGAVLSEALASRDAYLARLAELAPKLEETAYKRYAAENERLADNLSALRELASDYYDRLYTSNRDAKNSVNAAAKAESAEKQRVIENARTDEQNRVKNERDALDDIYKHTLSAQQISKNNIDLRYYPELKAAEPTASRAENEARVLENAKARGFFVSGDEEALTWLSEFRNPSGGYVITPWLADAKREYDVQHAKSLAQVRAKAGI